MNDDLGGTASALPGAAQGTRAPVELPIVGLGASAGGLEALRLLLAALPADTGIALVVIQHLDPDRESLLASVLGTSTPLPVVEARDGVRAEPNHVYVIPPDADLAIVGGTLSLAPRSPAGRLHLPIDTFFRSLALDRRQRAIGVVLSGSGRDGTEGLRAIKAEGGIALAQAPESAQFRSMPESAVAAGVVDFAGSPEELARELARLARHPYVTATDAREAPPPGRVVEDDQAALGRVLALVRQRQDADFSGYKRTTVLRRVQRRMALRHAGGLADYEAVLRDDPAETRALAEDMLIHVTSFFRDPEAFDALERVVFPRLAARAGEGAAIRVWVPGCSTGEEVYGIAIRLLEYLGDRAASTTIKLFGSDFGADAVEHARLGVYSDAALADVSAERLARFFERAEGGYRIGRRVRDLCVFVRHDLTRDPPFAKLDLISCRNVLIYFDAELQRRILPMLHYCLAQPGFLFLGHSEAIGGFRELFTPLDERNRIFEKTGQSPRILQPFAPGREPESPLARRHDAARAPVTEAQRLADHILLARFAPPGVLVDDRLQIVQFRGRTGAFLEAPPGAPDANVVRMARASLAPHLHEALRRAKAEGVAVRVPGLQVDSLAGATTLEVVPLLAGQGTPARWFLVLFHPEGAARAAVEALRPEPASPDAEATARLSAELAATREYLQAVVGEHQVTTDELAATNEEFVAANEELQSTNEELQSAKEELQSTNEELSTVNDELRARNAELDQLANDLTNVLASVEIPVIIVDLDLKVRRFTPTVRALASFLPTDVGRPIEDLALKVKVEDLAGRIRGVIAGLAEREWEIEGPEGRWFRMQIRPYRTPDRRLDGAVLSFVDVDALRRAVQDAERARDGARRIVDTVPTALLVVDAALVVRSANRAFAERFGLAPTEVEGHRVTDLPGVAWDDAAQLDTIARLVEHGEDIPSTEVAVVLPTLGRRTMALSGRSILWGAAAPMVLLSLDDVTELRALESERERLLASEKQARHDAEQANRAKDLFLATLSHELRTPLGTLVLQAQLLRRTAAADPRVERACAMIERAVSTQSRLIDDLLDVSRIVAGKLLLDLHVVSLRDVVQVVADVLQPAAEAKSITFEVDARSFEGAVYGDAIRLQQVVSNLVTNAIKFTPAGGRVRLTLERDDRVARITVADTGVGIPADVLPHVFSRFVQADGTVRRSHGGLGLGLAIVRHVVDAHGGEVHAESAGEGQGATFRVTLPLRAAQSPPAPSAPQVGARADVEGVRVLVVEDEDDARESIVATLRSFGAQVDAAPSVAVGLAAVDRAVPDVILCDVAMPLEDGYSFVRRLRERPRDRGGAVPAAAMTALASDADRRDASAAGFQLHVAKPVDSERLLEAVRALLALRDASGA